MAELETARPRTALSQLTRTSVRAVVGIPASGGLARLDSCQYSTVCVYGAATTATWPGSVVSPTETSGLDPVARICVLFMVGVVPVVETEKMKEKTPRPASSSSTSPPPATQKPEPP